MDLTVSDETVLHSDRLQDVDCNIGLVFLPADDFDQATKNLVIRVRVFPPLIGFVGWIHLCKLVNPARKLILSAGCVRVRGVPLEC